jgi:hypothetical protein
MGWRDTFHDWPDTALDVYELLHDPDVSEEVWEMMQDYGGRKAYVETMTGEDAAELLAQLREERVI